MVIKVREVPPESIVRPREELEEFWKPRTTIGKLVKEGKIGTIQELLYYTSSIPEPEIVDWFVGDKIYGYILNVIVTARMTDSGRRFSFRTVAVIGNKDGLVGVGKGGNPEMRFSIQEAITNAKKNLIPIMRGCGSWECRCNMPHSVPFKIVGECGSVRIHLLPAPRGTGLVAGEAAKRVLELAGVQDCWTKSFGRTRTAISFVYATYDALRKLYRLL
ncbi:MAG: 30S ribosomal protein S5 [Crenarchaeota archaeon]|nr:30S ribosomal protein S5 [Thermoproteota archaeon]MCR8453576.1 30S ribosomal protein S5 [Thermoproteota archaeon]MCR8454781.1 30S ribosomal protein S5 [Thermoproteota archaeon]MCR8462673.1 30S ribosomal protein S5 [Thermoproteota archaeon]MCR8470292.1 30S ribosomal protein S5 [Thermoproteota archaeon]